MHYYLALTSKCNLRCKYCYGKSCEDYLTHKEEEKYDFSLPEDLDFTVETLAKYSKDDSNFALTFYGGEPLLQIDKIKEIMDKIDCKTYMLQTNGMFLNKLDKDYVNKLHTILVSIDGNKEHTDERRGVGVYDTVTKNSNLIKQNGFQGEIIGRMTVDETCDIYGGVTHLYENDDFSFSSIHWQIDAQFWKGDYETRNFKQWSNTYNQGIKKLVNWWLDKIKENKSVPKIYPFIGIMQTLLNDEKVPMRCGAGHSLLGIQTNGQVVACPITAGFKPLYMGNIRNSSLNDIENNKILPGGLCSSCEIKDICGGRCLYANKSMLWEEKGFKEVCDTIFFLVNSLKKIKPQIDEMIKNKELKLEDFNYNKYNGSEIIP
ncbi:MAG: TIGR04084 family radical SAM/SPASM domain-containing protein [Candidatus Woesearchaeota archaeon]|jgi:uncharacterized protein|nr:TIGR04084 family radical SAM/SPASM domain-containing protein [Candidatus Woesearchaeota archaeon]